MILAHFSKNHSIHGIKISPHFHRKNTNKPLFHTHDFRIFQELDKSSGKDSSRMLASGAQAVYYIEATDESVEKAWDYYLHNFWQKDNMIIIESPALAFKIKAGVLLITDGKLVINRKEKVSTLLNHADALINFENISSEVLIKNLQINQNRWFWLNK